MPAPTAPAVSAPAATSACVCWRVGAVPHAGHCCFDGPAEAYQGDAVLPPCGHWHPVLPIEQTNPVETHGLAGEMERKVE